MDGLECSEVKLSYVYKTSDIFRIDSFFYAKEFLHDENQIMSIPSKTIKHLGASLKSFGAYSLNNEVEYIEHGIPFIRGINMKNGLIDFTDIICISEKANKLLWKSEVIAETILLSMSGTIGDVAIAQDNWKYPINSNQDIAKINFKDNINQYFVYAFFLSKYGQNYLRREARGSVQQHVFLSQMENFKIPLLTNAFQNIIAKAIKCSHRCNDQSQELYSSAEQMLLNELGLADFVPSDEQLSVKNFSESFGTSGRLDAEYYQTKYDEYYSLITKYQYGSDRLSNVCSQKDKNFKPKDKVSYRYIELSNIGASGDVTGYTIETGENLPSRARRIVQANDVIVSSVEGSLQSCALIKETDSGSICSTGFYILNSKKINSETLLVLFKSEPIQNLLKKGCSGTILTAISKDEFASLQIPLIDLDIQNTIAEKIQKSFKLRSESKALLEKAKKAVEIAIEQDETAAMHFLDK